MLKALRRFVLAASIVALPLAPAGAQVAHDPDRIAGCYEITGGLPAGYAASFCLTADFLGEFNATAPAESCVRMMNWSPQPDGVTPVAWPADFIHLNIDFLGPGCPEVNTQLTDDIYCDLIDRGPDVAGMNCTFDEERSLPLREVTVIRVN